MVLGECREEKAAYVKVREAKMMTLSDKVRNGGSISYEHLSVQYMTGGYHFIAGAKIAAD